MANKSLFFSRNTAVPPADSYNEAGGRAFCYGPKHTLAQMAATGCFNGVFYATAESQLAAFEKLLDEVRDDLFLAKLAVYARQRACMKDMPAALLAVLARRNTVLFHRAFDRVVDNGRVLRTLMQMIRSGRFGRTGLSSSLQRAFQRWLNEASTAQLLSASIGHDPSLRDVLRLARPTPRDNQRRALFGWLTGKEPARWAPATESDLPAEVQTLRAYRAAETAEAQALLAGDLNVRWDLLADAARGRLVWKAIARRMGPQALRMNLNTLLRHDVFRDVHGRADEALIDHVVGRLGDAEEIRRSRQFPYQYLSAYQNAAPELPHKLRTALHRAAELACGNVPQLLGPVVIGVDTSGSMSSPVTGNRGRGATSRMRCVDVAAVFAAALLRRNPESVIVPFDTRAYDVRLDASDSILSLAERLATYGGGGTDCSLPLAVANRKYRNRRFAGVVIVSDCESWVYRNRMSRFSTSSTTGMLQEWQTFVTNQRRGGRPPKLVCINIQPYGTAQAPERNDILNVGGFSDAVFQIVASFLDNDASRLVAEVESIEL